jgi:hypothetical protein
MEEKKTHSARIVTSVCVVVLTGSIFRSVARMSLSMLWIARHLEMKIDRVPASVTDMPYVACQILQTR